MFYLSLKLFNPTSKFYALKSVCNLATTNTRTSGITNCTSSKEPMDSARRGRGGGRMHRALSSPTCPSLAGRRPASVLNVFGDGYRRSTVVRLPPDHRRHCRHRPPSSSAEVLHGCYGEVYAFPPPADRHHRPWSCTQLSCEYRGLGISHLPTDRQRRHICRHRPSSSADVYEYVESDISPPPTNRHHCSVASTDWSDTCGKLGASRSSGFLDDADRNARAHKYDNRGRRPGRGCCPPPPPSPPPRYRRIPTPTGPVG